MCGCSASSCASPRVSGLAGPARLPPCQQEELACSYRLEVQTSDVRRAGTAGNVYVTLVGDACTIGVRRRQAGARLVRGSHARQDAGNTVCS